MDDFVTQKDGQSSIDLIVQGAHCGGCLSKIERGVSALQGVQNARMNLSTMRLHVDGESENFSANRIVETLSNLGYGAAPYEINAAQSQSRSEVRSLLKAMAVAGFAAMNVMLLSIAVWSGGSDMTPSTHTIFHWISALIALPAVAYAGQPFFKSAWAALKKRQTNMDVPISLALILACGLSIYETVMGNPDTYFDAALMLLFLLLIGRYLDAKLRHRTGEAAQRLAAMQSTSATRLLDDGKLETIPTRQVAPGDTLIIPAGQRIPVDAEIISGRSEIDTKLASGESLPVLKTAGDPIYSGMINLTAPLTVKALAAETDSFLAEISNLVQIGEQNKSRFVKIADKAARAYVPIVHSLALLTFIGWLLVGAPLRQASLNAIAVLIITCPCALGLAVPAVHIVASGRLFAKGVLLKSGDALERLAEIKSVIFDKTGTLTEGIFELENEAEIAPEHLAMAAALCIQSRHPVAKALHPFAGDIKAESVTEIAGQGLRGKIDGKSARFGAHGASDDSSLSTTSWLEIKGQSPVRFVFSDRIRLDARDTVERLSGLNLSSRILSGDIQASVSRTAKQLGITQADGGVSPQEKLAILEDARRAGEQPLMVGDGLNDAPALANAHASAALATASDISRTTSDIILEGDRLSGLSDAVSIARQAKRRVVQNLSAAVIYNLIAVPLAVFGFVNPLIAALAMSGSSMIVTLNALRPMRS
ncbi:MAG: cadmium-translocating P-type ATPase [Hellea sp.]|nr:cadmium-translocating P-type ATPase [Hellea sp.]